MDLAGIRQHVAGRIKVEMKVASCAPFGGTASVEVLQEAAAKARPTAVRVGLRDFAPVEVDGLGATRLATAWIALVVAIGGTDDARSDRAMLDAVALVKLLGYQDWALGVDAKTILPADIKARNLYSGPLKDKVTAAVWRVDWKQLMTLEI